MEKQAKGRDSNILKHLASPLGALGRRNIWEKGSHWKGIKNNVEIQFLAILKKIVKWYICQDSETRKIILKLKMPF